MDFIATVYYSKKRGKLYLRYPLTVHIEGINGDKGYVTYRSVNGRKCKMNFYENDGGYLWTSLAIRDRTKISGRINRLVYSNLCGEIPKGYEIDHIDRNRQNNYPENLRLVTKKENNQNKDIKGEKNGFSKLKEREVREILELVLTHTMTKQEIADKYRVSFATIKAIRSGRNWLSFTRDIFEKHGIQK